LPETSPKAYLKLFFIVEVLTDKLERFVTAKLFLQVSYLEENVYRNGLVAT